MKTTLLLIALTFISCSLNAQKIKYKKDVLPYVESKELSFEGASVALKYHAQNVDENGELSEKALLLQYDNMYDTRLYLAAYYDNKGRQHKDLVALDSAIYFGNLSLKLYDSEDVKGYISNVEKLKIQIKKDIEEEKKLQEKLAHEQKYGLKTDTVKYIGGEFIGHCMVTFEKLNGEQIIFYNPDLGPFVADFECQMIDEAFDKLFKIEYKLEKQSFYTEDVGDQTVETYVLKSIQFPNYSEQEMFFADIKKKKKEMKMVALNNFLERNPLPERKFYDCDYCNEMKSRKIDVCNKEKVKSALIDYYWGGETVFFENDTVLFVNQRGEYDFVRYEITFCQPFNNPNNGRAEKCAYIKTIGTIKVGDYEIDAPDYYLLNWTDGELFNERGKVQLRHSAPKDLFLEELLRN